jgi:hypothetical protein
MNLANYECSYVKVDNGTYKLSCGLLTLGQCGKFTGGTTWFHLGSTMDTPEARRTYKELKQPLSYTKKLLELEAVKVLQSLIQHKFTAIQLPNIPDWKDTNCNIPKDCPSCTLNCPIKET